MLRTYQAGSCGWGNPSWENRKGRRAKGQPALSRGGEQTTRYCAPKSSSGYTAENTRFRFAVRGYSQTGRQAKPNRLSSRRRLLISSLDRRSAACAGSRHTLSRRRCIGVPAVRAKSILNPSPGNAIGAVGRVAAPEPGRARRPGPPAPASRRPRGSSGYPGPTGPPEEMARLTLPTS